MATEIPAHLFHDFPDRAHRHLLENRDNLRELLSEAVPKLSPLLDIDRAEMLKRQYNWPDWRRSENDLLFRIPMLDQQGAAAVCVLAEHQSQPDQAIALR